MGHLGGGSWRRDIQDSAWTEDCFTKTACIRSVFQTDDNIVGLVWFIKQGLIFLSYVHQKSEVRQQDEKKEVSDRVKLIDIDTIKAPTIAVRAFKVLQI